MLKERVRSGGESSFSTIIIVAVGGQRPLRFLSGESSRAGSSGRQGREQIDPLSAVTGVRVPGPRARGERRGVRAPRDTAEGCVVAREGTEGRKRR
ncbi:hypothetical protein E2C01_058775 [Portunus trituberculatus]|uniref:Uncharacterized protein n=1 Tax=Portunus trituberculatus TaxID=210409 RepID=A0A5B7H5N4_PORTR|nr:hypothetical protein [Portunus trituberculatus]